MIVQIALIAVVFSGNILGIPCNKKGTIGLCFGNKYINIDDISVKKMFIR